MKLLGYLFGWLIGSLLFALVLYWYGHLWMPRLQVAYWAQAYPVALITTLALAVTAKSAAQKLLSALLASILILSAIVQALVWVSIIPHPNF